MGHGHGTLAYRGWSPHTLWWAYHLVWENTSLLHTTLFCLSGCSRWHLAKLSILSPVGRGWSPSYHGTRTCLQAGRDLLALRDRWLLLKLILLTLCERGIVPSSAGPYYFPCWQRYQNTVGRRVDISTPGKRQQMAFAGHLHLALAKSFKGTAFLAALPMGCILANQPLG